MQAAINGLTSSFFAAENAARIGRNVKMPLEAAFRMAYVELAASKIWNCARNTMIPRIMEQPISAGISGVIVPAM